MPIVELSDPGSYQEHNVPVIDVVAIHGSYEDSTSTWTDRQANVLWLRDLYPHRANRSRILLYDYSATALFPPGEGSADRLLPVATTLIAELCAHRSDSVAQKRPIIFICHGIGGLLVKRALAFSETRRARRVQHQRSIYLSTYAILFMGTPHKGIRERAVAIYQGKNNVRSSQYMRNFIEGSGTINEIGDHFASIMNEFCIFNFWEEIETVSPGSTAYIVEEDSAAPAWDNVERCGIRATHSHMVKFGHADNYGYQLVREALTRYTKDASDNIKMRWHGNTNMSGDIRVGWTIDQNYPSLDDVPTNDTFATDFNKWFLVERKPTALFTGREAHGRHVKTKFSEAQRQVGRKSHAIFVVYGLGGSGKTQFCLKYAHDNRSRYWGVFWVDASNSENAEASFAKIDQQVRDGNNYSKSASYSAVMHWLLQCKKPWLVVLDNADDPDMDLSRFVPAGSHGHILVTTRNPSVVEYATVGHVKFHGMDPEEAINLLLRAARPIDQPESPNSQSRTLAERIASELGYLALPLAQAGATIRRKIYSLERYLHHYLGHRRTIMSYSRVQSVDNANMITTWEIPFQRIVNRPSIEHKDAADLLHIFAFMHFESIPEEVFQRSWSELEESQVDARSFPDILHPDRSQDFQARLRSAIRVLSSYSIAEHELETRAFVLHPVIHLWARERLTEIEQRKWLDCTISVLASSISPKLEASGRKFRQLLIPHMDSCLRTLGQLCPHFPDSAERATAIEKFSWVYAENGLWDTARNLQVKVVRFRSKHSGRWHAATISAKRHLGSIYWNLFEIRPLIELQLWMLFALWFMRPSFGSWIRWRPWQPDHVSYCLALDDLTQSLWLVGRRERSKQVGERAVKGLTRHLGQEDPQTLNAMFNLARTYLHLGDHHRSREMLVYVLRVRKKFFGMDHPDTLITRNELGSLLCAQKRHLPIAERLVENVLESRKRILGQEHAYTLWSINDLSKILCERGRSAEAAVMLRRIIPIVERTLGESHVGMSMTKSNLARALALCGEWRLAEELLGPLLGSMPRDHPDWIHAKYGYVRIEARLGNSAEVERSCNELLDQIAKSKVLAINNPRTIAIAEELYKVYRAESRYADIRALKTRVPLLNEHNFVGDKFDVYAVRKSSQALVPTAALPLVNQPERLGQLGSETNRSQSNVVQPSSLVYEYSSLPSNSSFRILELLPGQRDSELIYHLQFADWTQVPNYEALSYAWGDSRNKVSSLCDGKSLEITVNLRDALIQLRRPDRSRFLWADAICIDQKNLQERGQQVSIMRQIYANATKVVVWLGRDEDGGAARAVQDMHTMAENLCKDMPNNVADMKTMDDLYDLTNNASFVQDEVAWLPIAWYFSRSWFQRLWVFQEVNSGLDVDVVCGNSHISWDAVGLAATYIKRWPALREQISNVSEVFWYNAYIMRSRRQQTTLSAASMLSQGQNFVTSDPVDRIYALLGTLPLRKWESILQPDYKRSRQSLYLEVAKRCLVDDKDPFFLSYAQHNDGASLEDFPSWVPQWDQERVQVPIAIPKANWSVSSGSALSAQILENGSILQLHGTEFDVISSKKDLDPDDLFNATEQHSDMDHPGDHKLLQLWREERDLESTLYSSTSRVVKAFAYTFVLGYRINYGAEYQMHLMRDFSAYANHLVRSSKEVFGSYPELEFEASSGEWKNYMHEAHSMSYRRALIRTTKGYIGLAPNATRMGDVVCILFGCKVPYILRRVGDYYLLVGDAYIHDIMDGEAMEHVRSGSLKRQQFLIH